MHKIYMTSPELSFFQGAEPIVEELGGFPSMENGKLLSISIQDSGMSYKRYNVSLVFNIEKWAIDSSRYMDIPKPTHKYIQIHFLNIRDVYVSSPTLNDCGEFKFGNTTDRKKMYQDDLPSNTIVIQRPFYSFYMRSGHEFVLEFEDDECIATASFLDKLK